MMEWTRTGIFITLLVVVCACTQKNKTVTDAEPDRPEAFANDDELLDYIQKTHFNYMWEGAEKTSGLACERIHLDNVYPQQDQDVITIGGSGFGVAGLLVAIERNFINREEGVARLTKIVDYLAKADRFHGVWPHWLHGPTGKVKPFGTKDALKEECDIKIFITNIGTKTIVYFRNGRAPYCYIIISINNAVSINIFVF